MVVITPGRSTSQCTWGQSNQDTISHSVRFFPKQTTIHQELDSAAIQSRVPKVVLSARSNQSHLDSRGIVGAR
eukprot:3521497-Amphidinium_carterae.1